ncbi:MAG: hypothetical protein ACPGYT_14740, partial [Nitrospirales bacterium]
ACERIVDLIDTMHKDGSLSKKDRRSRIKPLGQAIMRHATKKFKRITGKLRYSKAFQEQRFPNLNHTELEQKVQVFCHLLKFPKPIKLDPLKTNLIRVTT